MRFKRVMRWSPQERMLRLFRLMWLRGEPGKPGGGYSAKLSFAVRPKLFRWSRECDGWLLTLFGVRVHFDKSYSGIHC